MGKKEALIEVTKQLKEHEQGVIIALVLVSAGILLIIYGNLFFKIIGFAFIVAAVKKANFHTKHVNTLKIEKAKLE